MGGGERGAPVGPAAAAHEARLDPFGQVGRAGERVLDGAGHGAQRQALGQRIDRLEGGQRLLAAGAQDVVGVGHLGDAVEELDPAGDDAALAGGERAAEPVGLGVEEDELELGQRVADVDAVGAAAHGGRLVQADLDLDGDDLGQMRLADRAAQAAVDAGGGQGQDEVGGVGDLHLREEARGLRADAVEGGQLGEEREEDVGAAHGRGICVIRAGCRSGEAELARGCRRGVAPSARRVARERASSRLARRRPLSSRMRRWWCQTGDREAEEGLEQAVQGRGVAEVGAADDVGDALVGVVDDDGEVVGGADVAAGEDGVAAGSAPDEGRGRRGRSRSRSAERLAAKALARSRRMASPGRRRTWGGGGRCRGRPGRGRPPAGRRGRRGCRRGCSGRDR